MLGVCGGTGNVLSHHKTIKDLEQYYSGMGMGDNKEVKEFLKHVTDDKDGWVEIIALYTVKPGYN